MTRQQKTEQQRAEEALAVATRTVTRLTKAKVRATRELRAIETELTEAERLLAYRQQHPALQQSTTPTTNTEEPTRP